MTGGKSEMEDSVVEVIDLLSEADDSVVAFNHERAVPKEDVDDEASVVELLDDDDDDVPSGVGSEVEAGRSSGCVTMEVRGGGDCFQEDESLADNQEDMFVIDTTPEFSYLAELGKQGRTNRGRVKMAERRAREEGAIDGGGGLRRRGRGWLEPDGDDEHIRAGSDKCKSMTKIEADDDNGGINNSAVDDVGDEDGREESNDEAKSKEEDAAVDEGNVLRKKRRRKSNGRRSRGKGITTKEGRKITGEVEAEDLCDEMMKTVDDNAAGTDKESDEDQPPAKRPSLSPRQLANGTPHGKKEGKKPRNKLKWKSLKKKEVKEVQNQRRAKFMSKRSRRLMKKNQGALESRKKLSLSKDENGNNSGTTRAATAEVLVSDGDDVIELSDDEVVFVKASKEKRGKRKALAFIPLSSTTSRLFQAKKVEEDDSRPLRPIVIDGCNVAFGHGKDKFSSVGLEKCIEYFEKLGHKVTAFVPQFRRHHFLTQQPEILRGLEKRGVVAFTPSRVINKKMVASYDDRFIVEYATDVGGIIVTRDNYRDLIDESPEWADTINNRLLMYTWVNDRLMFPQDPLGRDGPRLAEFLRFPKGEAPGGQGETKERTNKPLPKSEK